MVKRPSTDVIAETDGATAVIEGLEEQRKNKQQRLIGDDQVPVSASPVKSGAEVGTSSANVGAPARTATDDDDAADKQQQPSVLCCSGCGISDSAAHGALLLFDDPEEDNDEEEQQGKEEAEKKEERR